MIKISKKLLTKWKNRAIIYPEMEKTFLDEKKRR